MKYRVRADFCFDTQVEAQVVYDVLKKKLVSVKPIIAEHLTEGKMLQLELCRHDEGGSCEILMEEK